MPSLIAAWVGGWEVMLILTIVLILFAARRLPGMSPQQTIGGAAARGVKRWLILLVAQGFGTGRIPFAPGTFGLVVGILWVMVLLSTGHLWAYLVAAFEGVAFSVWLCDEAERILGKKDPSSVVLDEIIALPFCVLPWVVIQWMRRGHVMPPAQALWEGYGWRWTLLAFVLFRLFDIWKPWPIRRLQALPGGWGVTIDDLVAALCVAFCCLVILSGLPS